MTAPKYHAWPGRMTVDAKSAELAEAFLADIAGATDMDVVDLAEDLQLACEDAVSYVETRSGRKLRRLPRVQTVVFEDPPLTVGETGLLRELRDRGGLTYDQCGGPTLDALMIAGLAAWNEAAGALGWRRIKITEAGRARLDRTPESAGPARGQPEKGA